MFDLPRFKPNPIPPIHPVPEYAAPAALRAVYDQTKAGLGVPWMGVVAMAFAQFPNFYQCLWSAMEPVVAAAHFQKACQTLRQFAEEEAQKLFPVEIRSRLEALGYVEREIAEIQSCNEIFSSGNMPYLLMASLARSLLEGQEWQNNNIPGAVVETTPSLAKPILIEAHHADPTMAAVYSDIRDTLGLPFVNTDYRAFARWPSYLSLAWQDLKAAIHSPHYEHHVALVHEKAVTLAGELPNVSGFTPDAFLAAARQDKNHEQLLAVVQLFQWLLPGLVVNVSYFRAQLLVSAK